MNSITLDEFSKIFKYLIQNNKRLVDEGKRPSTVSLTSRPGLGKSEIVEEIANELGMTYVKLSVAQIEEQGDIVGFPIKEYEVITDAGNKWVPADLIKDANLNFTGNSRMSYATPAWLPREENPNGTIINLDDLSRCNVMILNALLEVMLNGKYVGWELPKYTFFVCTNNPDDGSNNITAALDAAAISRMINFPIQFSIKSWAKWAEYNQIDSRAINFALSYSNELFDGENQNLTINPRSYVSFCNAISGLNDWSTSDNLCTILNIAKGCFDDKDNVVGRLFTTFIENKLDKLISPEDMLLKPWDTIKDEIYNCVYTNGQYKPHIASILHIRLLNYCMYYFSQTGSKTDKVQDRLIEFLDAPEKDNMTLFTEDFLFNVINTLIKKYPARTNKFLLNPKIRNRLV